MWQKGESGRPSGWHHTPEAIEKIRIGATGRKRSEEAIEKSRQAALGNKNWLGRNHTSEQCKAISERMKGNKHGAGNYPTALIAYNKSPKAKIRTPEQRRKISQTLLGRKNPQHSEKMKELWQESDFRNKLVPHLVEIAAIHHKPTNIEKILKEYLLSVYTNEEIIDEHRIHTKRRIYRVDFAVPSLMLVFEADGEYWHQDKEHDRIRQEAIEEAGWKVTRFTGTELLSGAVQAREDQRVKA